LNLKSLRKLDLGACVTQRPTYFLSDTHIGGGGWADDILPRVGLLARFIDSVAGRDGVELLEVQE